MTTPDEAALLDRVWGVAEPEPVGVDLGAWRFELRGDEVADLAFDGSPVARSVRAVARDRDWNTVPTAVEGVERFEGGCRLRLAMRGLGADVTAALTVTAEGERIAVSLEATAHAEFLSNRLGLVVLHPPALAGEALVVGGHSGIERRTTFPEAVAPHQPAMDIATLAWAHDGVAVRAEFAGEVFEMEDQRNWTDASYKTYSTPLSLPFPVRIEPGAGIAQAVTFTARRTGERRAAPRAVVVELVGTGRPVPEVLLGASTAPDPTGGPADAADRKPLPEGVAGLLVELDTRTPQWPAALRRADAEAGALRLDVRIVAEHPGAVREAVDAIAALAAGRVVRVGVFSTRTHVSEPPLWAALADAARERLADVELVGGARSHFTELNRRHGDLPRGIPSLTFAITPQMHATERAQFVESVPMQGIVTRDAGRIAAGRPIHVGPITLRPRYNAVATTTPDPGSGPTTAHGYGAELVPGASDPRQSSAALEAWTVASFAAVAGEGRAADVASVAYFETDGPRGIRSSAGEYPVARAIAAIAALHGGELLVPDGALPPGVHAIGVRREDGAWRALVASLAPRAADVEVLVAGRTHPVALPPYGVVDLAGRDDRP
ncbi:hypothetical protein EDM22_03085 [Agromyces tardus]|uniref:Uncharacterized protein n=1 Tax=Agromyces tardus TaxID=2583849 RepID=A0A3M8ALM4_9MICO|nr:hypothetical protein [Agromyces tardus]RNB51939.1 hypothetical protein EDM22_03085 [Agromyces tardus]